ncbi:115aa long hypothetical protein [Pyrococcus horikoshii OT3]|uniref:Uncharacterized protein n=1 Tax=Pyrococcus horikoshii (strain ATCC 700860 / DSM 12428 / JCM 9974 / NBRC 100139 / OT-3) TaxID=70601 RepID=O58446_PYRHO|nr:115aa long hypothetical protein [Pyrococcus horikoshii OT3]
MLKLSPKEKEMLMKDLPIFLIYYFILFLFFWYGLSHKIHEEIREMGIPKFTSPSTISVIILLVVFYLRCRDNQKMFQGKVGFILWLSSTIDTTLTPPNLQAPNTKDQNLQRDPQC